MVTTVESQEAVDSPGVDAARGPERAARVHPLAVILVAGVIVRAALWMYFRDLPVRIVDAQDYDRLATGLVETGRYITPGGELSSLRPPLYAAWVSGIYRVFGVGNHAAVRAFDAVLSLLTVVLVYQLGCIAFSRRIAVWGAAFCCFFPALLGFNNLVLSEPLFTLLVTGMLLAAAGGIRRESIGLLALAGALAGLAALTRSVLLLFVPVLAAYLVVIWRGAAGRRLLAAAAPVLAFAIVIAPWSWRNTRLQETLTFVDVMGGRNAMMGNYEHTPLERSWATISIVEGDRSWHAVLSRETPEWPTLTQGQRDKVALKHGMRFVLAHPLLTLKRDAVKFFNFWQLERTLVAGLQAGFFGDVSKVTVLAAAALICGTYGLALFAGVFGVAFAGPADRRLHWMFLLLVAVVCGAHTLTFAHSRYCLPLMPVVLLYAAAAVLDWRGIWERRRTLRFGLASAACVVLTLAWARELIFVDFAKAAPLL